MKESRQLIVVILKVPVILGIDFITIIHIIIFCIKSRVSKLTFIM